MLFETITLCILINLVVGITITDYTSCNWFGNATNAPVYPIDVCTAQSQETELDGLWLHSTKLQCDTNGQLIQLEWNNTNCEGQAYNTKNYKKDDGYYFNCGAKTSCPWVKIVFWELSNLTTQGHQHICAFDTHIYHQTAIVTNICINMTKQYNASYYVDCDAKSLTYSEYTDDICNGTDYTIFSFQEGCDDPFDFNAYVQISECDDANYNPPKTTMPTTTILTTMPSETPPINTPSPTTSTTKLTTLPTMTRLTLTPSASPSASPIVSPSASPSVSPSTSPSVSPSTSPSVSPSASPIVSGDSKSDSSSSKGSLPWIIIVVLLCAIIIVLILLVFYVVLRQKKLKAELLLNESVNVTH